VSEFDVYLRLRARAQRRAVPAAGRRHVTLVEPPLAVVGYHLAAEPGAPLGLCYGTAPESMRAVVVVDPRDRERRTAALDAFAADLCEYLDGGFAERAEVVKPARRGAEPETEQVCVRAPQLLVPNRPTAAWLCDILGRVLRHRAGESPAAAHLAYLATRRVLPGAAAVLVATEALAGHWRTGQLPAEDANLHALLAWIDPPDGDGAAAALAAESLPPAGPVPDPGWDADVLRGALDSGDEHRVRDAVVAALIPAWQATWRARELLAALPVAERTAARYELDRRAWTHHLDRVAAGTAYPGRRLGTLRSFAFLAELERRTAELERQQALDDPLVMARYVAAGDALAGTVIGRDLERFEPSPRGNPVRRPGLTLRPELAFDRPPGTMLWLADRPAVQLRTESTSDGEVVCTVVKGMGRSLPQADAAVPELGERVVLAPFGPADAFPTNLPDELPWTHREPQ
jgi:hypothetical protein